MPYYRMPDGEQLYVREYGAGQPVLVLSGLGMQSWQWHPFLYHLRGQFKFIIPDWRGFGRSAQCQIPDMDAISSHWRDIHSLLEQQPYNSYRIIAYSMGATTAMHGMRYGDFSSYIHSYLHIDQTPKIRADSSWPFGLFGARHSQFNQILSSISQVLNRNTGKTAIQQMNKSDRISLLQSWLNFIDLQDGSKTAPFLIKHALKRSFLQPYVLPIQRLDYLSWYIENYLHHKEDYREALSQLRQPAVFFIGEQSKLYPPAGQHHVAGSLPNARIVSFHKSGHTPLLSEPLKFSREIKKFLNL